MAQITTITTHEKSVVKFLSVFTLNVLFLLKKYFMLTSLEEEPAEVLINSTL